MNTLSQNKNFKFLILGQFITLLGNSIQKFALSIYILDRTGSASTFSLFLALCVLPQIIISPFGGAIADRSNKKKMLIFLDIMSAVIISVFFLMFFMQNVSMIFIGVFMLLLAVTGSIYDPVVRAIMPAIVSPADYMKANSFVSAISSVTLLAGPVCAGFLFSIVGIKIIFLINLISFLCSAFMESLLLFPATFFEHYRLEPSKIITDMKDSLLYLYREQRFVLSILFLSAAINFFITPIYTIGISSVLKLCFHVSNQLFGISLGIIGGGMIVGAFAVSKLNKLIPIPKMYSYFILLSFLILSMGLTVHFYHPGHHPFIFFSIFTALGFLFSLIITITNISFFTILQKETPLNMMGKVMSLVMSMCSAFTPVGQILYGFLFENYMNQILFIYLIAFTLTLILGLVLYKMLGDYTRSNIV